VNLYKISQSSSGDFTYDCAIVCAADETAARNTHPSGHNEDPFLTWCETPDQVTVELVGVASPGIPEGVLVASFNAG
jgi:hypothetical protein